MSSTNDAVFHRRNKQIQDAIDGQNLKQALQLIEKRMKKGEDTRFLRVCFLFLFLSYISSFLLLFLPIPLTDIFCIEKGMEITHPLPSCRSNPSPARCRGDAPAMQPAAANDGPGHIGHSIPDTPEDGWA